MIWGGAREVAYGTLGEAIEKNDRLISDPLGITEVGLAGLRCEENKLRLTKRVGVETIETILEKDNFALLVEEVGKVDLDSGSIKMSQSFGLDYITWCVQDTRKGDFSEYQIRMSTVEGRKVSILGSDGEALSDSVGSELIPLIQRIYELVGVNVTELEITTEEDGRREFKVSSFAAIAGAIIEKTGG